MNHPTMRQIYIYLLFTFSIVPIAGCGGGASNQSDSTTATTSEASSAASSSESSSSGAASITLASCLSATTGKTFTKDYDGTTASLSIGTGTLNGISATTETVVGKTNTSTYYSVYSATSLQVLGVVNNGSDGTSSTILYEGDTIDLTISAGESSSVEVTDGVAGDLVKTTYTFEGTEQLEVAGKTLTTCKVSMHSVASSATSSATTTGTFWYAAGYGYVSPAKEIIYNADGSVLATGGLLTL